MRKRGNIVSAVKQLGYTCAATDPVSCGKRVYQSLCQHIRAHNSGNIQVSVPHACPLKLVFNIARQPVERYPEKVLHQVACKLEPFICIMVFVVCFSFVQCKFKACLCHSSQELRLEHAVCLVISK